MAVVVHGLFIASHYHFEFVAFEVSLGSRFVRRIAGNAHRIPRRHGIAAETDIIVPKERFFLRRSFMLRWKGEPLHNTAEKRLQPRNF